MQGDMAEACSVLYAPALAEVVSYELVPDKPRVRGGILITFRDERGALVAVRLLHSAADPLRRVVEAAALGQMTDVKGTPRPNVIEHEPAILVDAAPSHDLVEVRRETLLRT